MFTAVTDMFEYQHFAFHCHYGYLNDSLKNYLVSMEVPCPKFLQQNFKVFPRWRSGQSSPLYQSMWHFFRTLSREVSVVPETSIYQRFLYT